MPDRVLGRRGNPKRITTANLPNTNHNAEPYLEACCPCHGWSGGVSALRELRLSGEKRTAISTPGCPAGPLNEERGSWLEGGGTGGKEECVFLARMAASLLSPGSDLRGRDKRGCVPGTEPSEAMAAQENTAALSALASASLEGLFALPSGKGGEQKKRVFQAVVSKSSALRGTERSWT